MISAFSSTLNIAMERLDFNLKLKNMENTVVISPLPPININLQPVSHSNFLYNRWCLPTYQKDYCMNYN